MGQLKISIYTRLRNDFDNNSQDAWDDISKKNPALKRENSISAHTKTHFKWKFRRLKLKRLKASPL